MIKLPTRVAEQVYRILIEYAKASPDYHEKEVFIFHFSIIRTSANRFDLSTTDGNRRVFYCTDDRKMWVEGKDCYKANVELRKVMESISQEFIYREFTVRKHAI